MTDERLDTQIRALMIELVDSTPPAPTWESIQAQLDPAAIHTAVATDVITDAPAPERAAPGAIAEPVRNDDDRLPTYIHGEEGHKPRWRPIAGAMGAVGVLVGGSFAFASLTQDDGATTPEAAVEQFVEAVADEDALGALEALPPSERELLADAFQDIAGEAERLGATQGLELGDVDGFDFEINDMTLEPEQLGEGIVAIHIDGTLTSSSTGAELPLGQMIRDTLVDSDAISSFEEGVGNLPEVFADEDVFIVAIEEDGGWHASSWYTIAEYIRRAEGKPLPTFGGGAIPAIGAATPEEATRTLIEGISEGNLQGVLQLGLPGESRVLYDYGPLFLPDAQEAYGTDPIDLTINSIDLEVQGDGSVRTVVIKGYDYTTTYVSEDGEETVRTVTSGDCFDITSTSPYNDPPGSTETTRSCRDDLIADGELTALDWELATHARVVVVEQDGRWFVSPVRTVSTSIIDGLRLIPDTETARTFFDRGGIYSLFPGSLFNLYGFGGYYPISSSSTETFNEDGEVVEYPPAGENYTVDEDGNVLDENGEPFTPEASVPTTMVATSVLAAESVEVIEGGSPASTVVVEEGSGVVEQQGEPVPEEATTTVPDSTPDATDAPIQD